MSETIDLSQEQLTMSNIPHLRQKRTSAWIMKQVIIALMFPTLGALYFFGWRVLLMIAVAVGSCVLFEYLFQKLTKRPVRINDYSAVVTGLLIALSLPVSAPLWTIVLGSGFAILVIKQLFGGIGRNWFNPAVGARIMLSVFFGEQVSIWVEPGAAADATTQATPLGILASNGAEAVSSATYADAEMPALLDMFLGTGLPGNVGETSKLLILIAFGYLVVRRIIDPHIPLFFILPVAVIPLVTSGFDLAFMMEHVLGGALIFAAVFMITDYSSSPFSPLGKIVFAIGAGILTVLFRYYSDYAGGVGFAILIMNATVPLLDKYLQPRIYGHKRVPVTARILSNG
ncbi:electron transport complex protein RnfD [Natronobacillus azotifigens]|uniref:Ion-translocating oxidoreductase complex subunit D n=1 Tax=Natronobacillus azotifigens TaxID=472978 RepID=A0A9J6RCP2_9BACI|nr:RnfABCDGE type electron transport complex subunit D [Natronobacillus azotifigens]MCZ0703123.1 RnfABCDGE type electron transport complex subunit D [Natronobacillus azotifigens]